MTQTLIAIAAIALAAGVVGMAAYGWLWLAGVIK